MATAIPRTKESLIRSFTVSKPYALEYQTLGRNRQRWLDDKPVLEAMITEGTVKVVDKTRKSILYQYTPLEMAPTEELKKLNDLLNSITLDINSCEVVMHKLRDKNDEMKSLDERLSKLWTEAYDIKKIIESNI